MGGNTLAAAAGVMPIPGIPMEITAEGTTAVETASRRDNSDLEGKVDCEKGVVGDVSAGAVLAEPLELLGKAVRNRDVPFLLAKVSGSSLRDVLSEMYVSMHLAGAISVMEAEYHDVKSGGSANISIFLPRIVSSYSPGWSKSNSLPAPSANTMLSLYSCS